MTTAELNAASKKDFLEAVGWVYEDSPWVAERAWERRPFGSRAELHASMHDVLNAAPFDEKLALLRAHPDLGVRAKISPASTGEQARAGLDRLTPDEYATLLRLNIEYRSRFGFPFLFAVKGATKSAIFESLAARVGNSYDVEFAEALRQVDRIAGFRLETLIVDDRGDQ